jgi:hypothetical protein
LADLTFLGSPPTDAELEDCLDADHDPRAMQRVIESALGYMKRGAPVPYGYIRYLECRLLGKPMPAGAPPIASLLRVGDRIESLTRDAGLSISKARKQAAQEFRISLSTATNYHRRYIEAKRGCSPEEYEEWMAANLASEGRKAREGE